MAANADEVVVTLVAKTDSFDAKVKGLSRGFQTAMGDIGKSATSTERVLDNLKKKMSDALSAGDQAKAARLSGEIAQIEGALGRVNATSGRTRMGMQQLGFQMNDVATQMAMGTKATTIFAQQSGQMIQALQMMGGEGNAFLRFLGGPWGIGLSVAAVALTPLIGKLFDSKDAVGDLVQKLKEHAEKTNQSAEADEVFARSLEGIQDRIRNLNETLKELQNQTKTQTQLNVEQTETLLNEAEAYRAHAQAVLDDARARLAAQRQYASGPGQANEIAALGLDRFQGYVDTAQAALDKTDKAISKGRTLLAQFKSYEAVAEGSLSAADKIHQKYEKLIEDKRKQQLAEGKTYEWLVKQTEELRKQEKIATDKLKPGSATNNRQSGRQIDFSQAESIARAAGLQVNSGYRSTAEQAALYNNPAVNRPGNPVALPGSSAHNGANGKWAIDIQITDGVTPGKIRQIYAEQGVSLTKVLKEKGHFHIEGSRSEAAAAEKEQDRAAQQAIQEQNRFEGLSGQLNDALLAAKKTLIHGVDAQAAAAEQQVRSDEARLDQSLDNQVEEGKLTAAHADELKALGRRIAVVKLTAIEAEKRLRIEQSQFELETQERQFKIDDLRFADEVAQSQAEHREIQLQIIDAMYEQKKLELEHQKQLAERNGATQQEIDAIQGKIDRLPTEKAHDRRQVDEQTAGPLESWLKSVPQDAQAATEALQKIEVDGLDHLSDALTNVIMGTESLGKAFGDVAKQILADIVKLILRMLIMKAVMSLFGLGRGPLGFAGGGLVGGSNPIFTPANPGVPAATGGLIVGPGTGTSDSIPAMLSNGEFVVRKKVVDQIGIPLLQALNEHGASRGFASGGIVRPVSPSTARVVPPGGRGDDFAHVILELNDPLLQVKIAKGSAAVIEAAAPGIVASGAALARNNLARKQKYRLG